MPIYEFECVACGLVFERIKSADDAGRGMACPKCGKWVNPVMSVPQKAKIKGE